MKVYYKGRYIKSVPAEFKDIPDLANYFEDIDHVRLSIYEWWILKLALFEQKIKPFIQSLSKSDPASFMLIEKSSPLKAFEVSTDDGQIYHSLLFRNGKSIVCHKSIYLKCPERYSTKYPDSLVAKPKVEQLKIF